jgi:DNA-binding HxlR family transcriptional regulator
MISQTLRVLQDDAVVERTVGEDGRPSYALTATGREIAQRVRDLSEAIYAHLERRGGVE